MKYYAVITPKKVDLAIRFYKNTFVHLVNIVAVNNVVKTGVKIIQQVNNLQSKNAAYNIYTADITKSKKETATTTTAAQKEVQKVNKQTRNKTTNLTNDQWVGSLQTED